MTLVFLHAPPWDKKWKFERESVKKYLYRDFDIVIDLYNNYDTILKKVKRQNAEELKLRHKRLLLKLENALKAILNEMEDKHIAFITLKKYKNINCIINSITENEEEKNLLLSCYNKILSKIEKLYRGDIQERKMELKAQKEKAKVENKNKAIKWVLFNFIMTKINKSIPKGHNPKKKY